MGPKRVAHTTISSNGLQDELVIGGVGVFGNLGERKVNSRSGVHSRGEYLVKNVRGKGRGQDAETSNRGCRNWCHAYGMVHSQTMVQILERQSPTHFWNRPTLWELRTER